MATNENEYWFNMVLCLRRKITIKMGYTELSLTTGHYENDNTYITVMFAEAGTDPSQNSTPAAVAAN